MKKLLLIVALAVSCVAINAQDIEGKWFVGGQFGYSHTKAGDAKADNYTILPMIGKFISSDIAIGAQLGYAGSKAGEFKTNAIVVAPLVRKYWNISGGFNFFGQVALPIAFGDTNEFVDKIGVSHLLTEKAKTTSVQVELSPGFDYIINDKFSIETSFNVLSLGYNQTKEGDYKETSFGFFANPEHDFGTLRVGFKMIF